jgi:5-methylcytosine-specific restriction endonuclease McrA
MAKYGSIDNLRRLVSESRSFAEVARQCGYTDAGGTVAYLRKVVRINEIPTGHFVGQGWSKGKTRLTDDGIKKQAKALEKSWEEVFCCPSKVSGKMLLTRLTSDGKRPYACEQCKLSDWLGQYIRLQVHHKNGDNLDNREENLQILCPNCHSQTSNFAGRNNRRCG